MLTALVRAAGRSATHGETDDLAPFLEHDDPEVRRAALVALCRPDRSPGPAVGERLVRAREPEDRAVAVRAVGGLPAEHLLPEVAAGLDDADPEGRVGFVASEVAELRDRSVHRVLALLTLGHDPERMARVEASVFSDDATARNNALELLEGLLDPEEESLVLPWRKPPTTAGRPPGRGLACSRRRRREPAADPGASGGGRLVAPGAGRLRGRRR